MTTLAAPLAPLSERRFYTGMALALVVVVLAGFARSFFLRPLFPDHPAPREPFFALHGVVFTAWMALLLTQARLVAAGRVDLHRRLGAAGAGLAVLMAIVGVVGAVVAARRPEGFIGVPVPPLQFLAVPLFDVALFAVLVALAILRRRDAQSHKRLMLLATIGLVTAAIARLPGVLAWGPPAFFGLTDLFIVAIAIRDVRTRGRLHPATLWGGLALIASQPLRLVVSGTDAWLAFARWITGVAG